MPIADAVSTLARDLQDIFGSRLVSVVAYHAVGQSDGAMTSTLAIVASLTADDLRACAARVAAWQDADLPTPLLLEAGEFARSLDAFPLEFGAILDDHAVVFGATPFERTQVHAEDLRRACEVQARSHLLHLREGYIETEGRGDLLADLIGRSSLPLAALLRSVKRVDANFAAGDSVMSIVQLNGRTPPVDDARRLFPSYLADVQHLVHTIDRWSDR